MEWEKDGFVLRPAREEDAQRYYEENYCPLDHHHYHPATVQLHVAAAQKGQFLPRELNNAAAIPLIAVQLELANEI